MKITTTMFAAPIVAFFVGVLMQPVGAQTYTYTRTVTSYDSPSVVERIVEDPVIVEHPPILMDSIQHPMTIERKVIVERPVTVARPVTIERPVVIESPAVVERPLIIKEHTHHAFHLGLFPFGGIDVF